MKKIIFYCSLLAVLLVSCKDDIPSAKLNVWIADTEYHVGDTVTFRFSGNPDNIVFYSGETGHNYELKDRLYADNDLLVDFKSYVSLGVIDQNLQCYVSNDFNGVYDETNVEKATWTDISHLFTFSTGADQVPSGVVNLKSYVSEVDTAQVYFAFRYTDTGQKNRWVIRTINVDKVSPEGVKTTLATMSTMGWKAVDFSTADKWTITSAQLLIQGKEPNNDDWVISKPFRVKTSIADEGVALKNISTKMNEYKYVYQEAGTFKAVFATSSVWYSGSEYSETEVTVNVKP
ncbi:DUF5017 domain-containing protein [Dysgonomonas sp. 520]|uniref:DUF5017 domain-containing protein n=1 Tax=Dysgonomonas sp. 520 TaxID=2302931 RepID=UPI0013D108EC|nr:DUF5017 domain-containing protein [Dysgonomonas sp. 520]NDW08720.1 DUF5017 domain-containing protein [Dysgonomonas sp. 520]